jgi:spermidine synthase
MQWYFFFFLVSGFCSVLYEVIWLRLAMAQYGVTTPMVSLVLSMFMLGLGLGSLGAGHLVGRWGGQIPFPPLRLYALAELLIGISALLVPLEFSWGRQLLESLEVGGWSPISFYLTAGACIAVSLVPWCFCMGATFPLAMLALEQRSRSDSQRSFSYLYLANVLGAVLGALIPLLLIEAFGFHRTLRVGAVSNFLLAACALRLTFRARPVETKKPANNNSSPEASPPLGISPPLQVPGSLPASDRRPQLWLLFGTGLISMASEVVWVRLYTPWLGTVVYTFAFILAFYLEATYIGSFIYRKWMPRFEMLGSMIWAILGFTALLPLLASDPRLSLNNSARLAIGIVPFSCVLGLVTPLMIDRFSDGDGERAGRGYAVNILGCILGPLVAGFILLPSLGEHASLGVLALPCFAVALFTRASPLASLPPVIGRSRKWLAIAVALVALVMILSTNSFEEQFAHRWVRRDYTATVVAEGDTRLDKRLFVNGVGMTELNADTKMMAHLPLATMDRKPTNILIICFGMGTTHRSALSWGVPSTVVELVPGVPKVYGFFHADGPTLLQSPNSHVVIDDGRLFLERTTDQYDVIAIDPPPPVQAAASSLLYSEEFYRLVKRHLRADGILQQWLPPAEAIVQSAVIKALQESFPHVRVINSILGDGTHFLASMSALPHPSAAVMASRMPAAATADMLEWGPESNPERQFALILGREISPEQLVQLDPNAPAMVDDRPVNEYYYLRHRSGIEGWIFARLSGS